MSIQIADITPRRQYIAAAAQTVYVVPFPFYVNTDLLVFSRVAGSNPDDAIDILVLTTDYTVTGAGAAAGGTVTLVTASTAGDIVTIVRDMPEARYNLYLPGGAFTSEAVNADFSRDVMMSQQNELSARLVAPTYDYNAVISAGSLIMDTLPAGYSWRMNAAGTRIESFLAAAVNPSVTNSLIQLSIVQAAHGLVAGNVVRTNAAGLYVVSQADTAANAEVVGYVSVVTDANTFTLLMGGMITTGLAGLTPGSVYYLDPAVAGAVTIVKPVAVGQVVKPVLQAASATTGIWLNYLGAVL